MSQERPERAPTPRRSAGAARASRAQGSGAATWPSMAADLLGLVGFAGVVTGAWLVYEPAGLIIAGVLMLGAGIGIARRSPELHESHPTGGDE